MLRDRFQLKLVSFFLSYFDVNLSTSGIPESTNAYTVNKVCSSSLKALILATQSHQLGYRGISLVVGTESMSNAPFYLDRGEHTYGDFKMIVI